MTISQIESFWSKVEKSSCWLWTAAKTEKGYGVFSVARRTFKAHRISYELLHGPIPKDLCVLHRCDVSACVNPNHLFLGTRADNNADMLAKGRHIAGGTHCGDSSTNGMYPKGSAHHNAKLTADLVREIRSARAAGMSFAKLAKKYRLSTGYVFRLINRGTWRDV